MIILCDLMDHVCAVQVVETLLPFDKIGPFVSMVKDSFKAALPFTGLGVCVLLGFSFAVRVVHNYTEHKKLAREQAKANKTKSSNDITNSTADLSITAGQTTTTTIDDD